MAVFIILPFMILQEEEDPRVEPNVRGAPINAYHAEVQSALFRGQAGDRLPRPWDAQPPSRKEIGHANVDI